VRANLAAMRALWARWREAQAVREAWSWVDIAGGAMFGFDPDTSVPANVAEALATFEEHLRALDVLRHDEAAVREFRRQDTGWDRRAEDVRRAEAAALSRVES
jgi:hypothetical protein